MPEEPVLDSQSVPSSPEKGESSPQATWGHLPARITVSTRVNFLGQTEVVFVRSTRKQMHLPSLHGGASQQIEVLSMLLTALASLVGSSLSQQEFIELSSRLSTGILTHSASSATLVLKSNT